MVAIQLSQLFPYTPTGQEKILFECADPGFPKAVIKDEPSSCKVVLTSHLGEPQLPLSLPENATDAHMLVAAIIFAGLVLWPLYAIFAHWWMGEPYVLLPHDEGES